MHVLEARARAPAPETTSLAWRNTVRALAPELRFTALHVAAVLSSEVEECVGDLAE